MFPKTLSNPVLNFQDVTRERKRRVKKTANEELAKHILLIRIPILCTKSQQTNTERNKDNIVIKEEIERQKERERERERVRVRVRVRE